MAHHTTSRHRGSSVGSVGGTAAPTLPLSTPIDSTTTTTTTTTATPTTRTPTPTTTPTIDVGAETAVTGDFHHPHHHHEPQQPQQQHWYHGNVGGGVVSRSHTTVFDDAATAATRALVWNHYPTTTLTFCDNHHNYNNENEYYYCHSASSPWEETDGLLMQLGRWMVRIAQFLILLLLSAITYFILYRTIMPRHPIVVKNVPWEYDDSFFTHATSTTTKTTTTTTTTRSTNGLVGIHDTRQSPLLPPPPPRQPRNDEINHHNYRPTVRRIPSIMKTTTTTMAECTSSGNHDGETHDTEDSPVETTRFVLQQQQQQQYEKEEMMVVVVAMATVDLWTRHNEWESYIVDVRPHHGQSNINNNNSNNSNNRHQQRLLHPQQAYGIDVSLVLPDSHSNQNAGMMGVTTELYAISAASSSVSAASSTTLLAISRRSCRFPYQSRWIAFVTKLILIVPLLWGVWEESRTVTVSVFRHYTESVEYPLHVVVVKVTQPSHRATTTPVEVISGSIRISEELSALQEMLKEWYYTCACIGTLMLCVVYLVLQQFLRWAAATIVWHGDASRQSKHGYRTTNSNDDPYLDDIDFLDLDDDNNNDNILDVDDEQEEEDWRRGQHDNSTNVDDDDDNDLFVDALADPDEIETLGSSGHTCDGVAATSHAAAAAVDFHSEGSHDDDDAWEDLPDPNLNATTNANSTVPLASIPPRTTMKSGTATSDSSKPRSTLSKTMNQEQQQQQQQQHSVQSDEEQFEAWLLWGSTSSSLPLLSSSPLTTT